MKQTMEKMSVLLTTLAVSLVLVTVPVAAQHGSDDSGSTATDSSTSNPATSTDNTGATTQTNETHSGSGQHQLSNESNNETEISNSAHGDGSLQSQAAKLLGEARQNGKTHSAEDRQKACEARQTALDHRFSVLGTNAQKFLDNFNSLFSKVQAYQSAHQLTVSNYDSLLSAVTSAQSTATSDVSALVALKGTTIDCSSSDPASTVATVKTATSNARTSLQAYRTALRALIVALIQAKDTGTPAPEASSNAQGGN